MRGGGRGGRSAEGAGLNLSNRVDSWLLEGASGGRALRGGRRGKREQRAKCPRRETTGQLSTDTRRPWGGPGGGSPPAAAGRGARRGKPKTRQRGAAASWHADSGKITGRRTVKIAKASQRARSNSMH